MILKNRNTPMNVVMVLNYKAPNETISCVESILKHCPSIDHAVVVDNDSQDGSIDVLQRWQADNGLSQVTVLASPRNDGYAGGNNYGMRWALDNLAVKHFWVVNNDAYVKDDAFAPLLAELQRAPKTIVGSVILSSQTGRLECYGGGILYPLLGKSKLLGKDIAVSDIAKLDRETRLHHGLQHGLLRQPADRDRVHGRSLLHVLRRSGLAVPGQAQGRRPQGAAGEPALSLRLDELGRTQCLLSLLP